MLWCRMPICFTLKILRTEDTNTSLQKSCYKWISIVQMLAHMLLVVTFTGSAGQEILFDPLECVTPCSQGLRSGIDSFTFTGTVGTNITTLLRSLWTDYITIEIATPSSGFKPWCVILFGHSGELCAPAIGPVCYCHYKDTTTDSAHFTATAHADHAFSEATLRGIWLGPNGYEVYSLNNVTLPVIYDMTRVKFDYEVNGLKINLTSDKFEKYLVPRAKNTLKLCCMDAPTPCYTRIVLNGTQFESNTSCIKQSIFVPSVNYKAKVLLMYAVCNKNDNFSLGVGVAAKTTTAKSTSTPVQIFSSSEQTTQEVTSSPTKAKLGTTTSRADQSDETTQEEHGHDTFPLIHSLPLPVLLGLGSVMTALCVCCAQRICSKLMKRTRRPPVDLHEIDEHPEELSAHSEAEESYWPYETSV